jgi:hypothetical protein
MAPDCIDHWPQQRTGGADPARQQCTVEIDAIARVDHQLAIQRQVIGELGHQNVRQQARAGQAPFDRAARCAPITIVSQQVHASLERT